MFWGVTLHRPLCVMTQKKIKFNKFTDYVRLTRLIFDSLNYFESNNKCCCSISDFVTL